MVNNEIRGTRRPGNEASFLLHSHNKRYAVLCRTAIEVEDIVESMNAVPATIGILDGKVHVGMSSVSLLVAVESTGSSYLRSDQDAIGKAG